MGYYYAVLRGRNPGIYDNWVDCEEQVLHYSNNCYKKFDTWREANNFLRDNGLYSDSSSESGSDDDEFQYDGDGYVKVWVDGACSHNGYGDAKAGIGVWFAPNHYLNLSEPARGNPTNNNAEIQAATRAMEQALDAGVDRLHIFTDSDLLFKSATQYMRNWRSNGWRNYSGQPVINKRSFIEMDNARSQLDHVFWTHVRGHSGDYGNQMADKLARRGAEQY